jgi:hypothetical protein
MKIRTFLSALLGVGLVATSATTAAGGHASATATTDPVIAEGTVRSATGRPLEGILVVAHAEHDQGRRTTQVELARTTTDADGEFELAGALRGPADRNADGSVRIELMALAADVVRYYLVNAHPPTEGGAEWTWSTTAADPSIVEAGQGLQASDLGGEPLAGLGITLEGGVSEPAEPSARGDLMVAPGGEHRTAAAKARAELARADAREAELAVACPSFADIYWQETSTTVKRGAPVHFAYVANKTKHRFEYTTTTNTSLSVAYTGVGKNYAGGLTGSAQNDTSAGLIGTKGRTTYTPLLWNLQWLYRKEDKWCFNMGHPYPMRRSRWLPVKWTGGNWVSHEATTFPCNPFFRAGSAHDFWVQRRTSSTWEGWFAIAGARLASSQERNSSIRGTYVLRKGKGRMVLCGREDQPADASFVEEVPS